MNPWDTIVTARERDMSIEVTYPDGDSCLFTTGGYSAHGHSGLDWIRLGMEPERFVTAQSVVNAIRMCDPDVRLRETQRAIAELELVENDRALETERETIA